MTSLSSPGVDTVVGSVLQMGRLWYVRIQVAIFQASALRQLFSRYASHTGSSGILGELARNADS